MTPGARAGVQRIEGLILGSRNVGERDRVLDVLVRTRGRMSVWSQKARGNARKQAMAALAPFVSVTWQVRPRTDGATLVSQDEANERLGLRSKLSALRRAGQLVTLAQALYQIEEPVDAALDTLEVALDHLAAGRLARAAGAYPRLLTVAGVMPSLERCSRCKKPFSSHRHAVAEAREVACAQCLPMAPPIEDAVLHALAGARVESVAVAAELETLIVQWASEHAGRSLRIDAWA